MKNRVLILNILNNDFAATGRKIGAMVSVNETQSGTLLRLTAVNTVQNDDNTWWLATRTDGRLMCEKIDRTYGHAVTITGVHETYEFVLLVSDEEGNIAAIAYGDTMGNKTPTQTLLRHSTMKVKEYISQEPATQFTQLTDKQQDKAVDVSAETVVKVFNEIVMDNSDRATKTAEALANSSEIKAVTDGNVSEGLSHKEVFTERSRPAGNAVTSINTSSYPPDPMMDGKRINNDDNPDEYACIDGKTDKDIEIQCGGRVSIESMIKELDNPENLHSNNAEEKKSVMTTLNKDRIRYEDEKLGYDGKSIQDFFPDPRNTKADYGSVKDTAEASASVDLTGGGNAVSEAGHPKVAVAKEAIYIHSGGKIKEAFKEAVGINRIERDHLEEVAIGASGILREEYGVEQDEKFKVDREEMSSSQCQNGPYEACDAETEIRLRRNATDGLVSSTRELRFYDDADREINGRLSVREDVIMSENDSKIGVSKAGENKERKQDPADNSILYAPDAANENSADIIKNPSDIFSRAHDCVMYEKQCDDIFAGVISDIEIPKPVNPLTASDIPIPPFPASVRDKMLDEPDEYDGFVAGAGNYYSEVMSEADISELISHCERGKDKIFEFSDRIDKAAKEGGKYYDRIKKQMHELFNSHEPYEPLIKQIKESYWVKIDYNGSYYAIGLVLKDLIPAYVCYAVSVEAAELPDDSFFLVEGNPSHYILAQCAESGKIVKPVFEFNDIIM